MKGKLLIINPGSTSTKIAVYSDGKQLWSESIEHTQEELAKYDTALDQLEMRERLVVETARSKGDDLGDLSAVVSRGGPFARISSGAYEVNDDMLHVMRTRPLNPHISLIGMAIAKRIADPRGIKAYIYDAVTVDEMLPVCRIVGLKEMGRWGQGHNLNMRAAALKLCADKGWNYYEKNILIAHLGGGITVSAHSKGRVVDIISDDFGPFAPERVGALPTFQVIDFCFAVGDKKEVLKRIKRGGLISLLGTPDARKVEQMIADGDERARLVYEAMALSVAKGLASVAAVINGQADAVILTGGIARSKMLTGWIAERVKFIAPVEIIPGENEMDAMAMGGYRVLSGQEKAHIFVDGQN